MPYTRRAARINVKLLVLLALAAGILMVGALLGHRFRKRAMAATALSAGTSAFEKQDYPEASKQLRQYLSKFPDDADALRRYAEANLAIRPIQPEKIGAAIGAYRRLLRQHPGDPKAWKELVKVYSGTGQHNEAAYVCRNRLEKDPHDAEARYGLGKALLAQRKLDEAQEVLVQLADAETTAENQRRQIHAFGMLSSVALLSGTSADQGKAIEWLHAAVTKQPQSAEARVQRARYFRTVERDAVKAEKDLIAAEVLPNSDPSVALLIVDEWLQWNRTQRASAAFTPLLHVDPATLIDLDIDAEAWAFARFSAEARLLLQQSRSDEGVRLTERALSELRDYRRLTFLPLAIELLIAGDRLDEASRRVDEFRQGLTDQTDVPESLGRQASFLTAKVAEAKNEPSAVLAALEQMSLAQSPPAEVFKLIWRACEATGQVRRAQAALEEYIKRYRGDAEALLALARMYRNRNWRSVKDLADWAMPLASDNAEAQVLSLEAQFRLLPSKVEFEALQVLSDALAKLRAAHPRNGSVRVLEAFVAFRQGQEQDARLKLEQALQEAEPDPPVELALATLLNQTGEADRAREVCRQGMNRHPQSLDLRLKLAELHTAASQGKEAEQVLREAYQQLKPEQRLTAGLALARTLFTQGDASGGRDVLTQLARSHPQDVRPRTALLADAEVRKDLAVAQGLVDELKSIEGSRRGTLWRLEQARLWLDGSDLSMDRQNSIEGVLRECLALDSLWSRPVLLLGRMYERAGRMDAAEEVYQNYFDSHPCDYEVAHHLLSLLERQHRFGDAERLLRLMPATGPLAHHRLAVAVGRGDVGEAMRELNERIAADPNDSALLILKAGLEYSKGKDVAAALALLDRAEQINPNALDVTATRLSILQDSGRVQEAKQLVDAVVNRRRDSEALLLRARFLSAVKEPQGAETDLVQATKLEGAPVESFAALAQFYADHERREEAVRVLDEALVRNPKSGELRRCLARLLAASSDPESRRRGRGLLEVLQTESPNDTRLLMALAGYHLADPTPQSAQEAAALLERVVALDPRNIAAHLRLIEWARRGTDRRAMESLITRAIGANPDDLDLRLVRAGFERESGNIGLARELARSVWEYRQAVSPPGLDADDAHRRTAAAGAFLAELALMQSDLGEARKWAESASRVDPNQERVAIVFSRVLEAEGKQSEAVSTLEAFLRTASANAANPVRIALAELLHRGKRYAEASRYVAEAESKSPDLPAVRMTRWRLWAAQGEFKEIAGALQWAARQPSADRSLLVFGAALLAESNEPGALETAKAVCVQLTQQHPDFHDGFLTLAQTAYRQRHLEECERAYRTVLKLDPFHRQALNDLAWVLANDLQRSDEALQMADRGLLRYPDDAHLLDTRGVILFNLNRLPEARKDLEKCLTMTSRTPELRAQCLLHLGQLLTKLGEREAAHARLREAQELNNQHKAFSAGEKEELRRLLGNT